MHWIGVLLFCGVFLQTQREGLWHVHSLTISWSLGSAAASSLDFVSSSLVSDGSTSPLFSGVTFLCSAPLLTSTGQDDLDLFLAANCDASILRRSSFILFICTCLPMAAAAAAKHAQLLEKHRTKLISKTTILVVRETTRRRRTIRHIWRAQITPREDAVIAVGIKRAQFTQHDWFDFHRWLQLLAAARV